MLVRQGVHPKVVQERLGHANVAITLDVYSHILPQMQAAEADKIDARMRAATAKQGGVRLSRAGDPGGRRTFVRPRERGTMESDH